MARLYHQWGLSVHVLGLSDCGANAGSGCIRDGRALLGAARVLHGLDEVVDQHYGFCCLPVLLNITLVGLETIVEFDPSGAMVTAVSAEAGSSLLLPEVAAASWNKTSF